MGANQDVLLGAWLCRMVLATLLTMLLARRLPVADFGFVTLTGTFLLVIHVLLDLGTGAVALREISRSPAAEPEILQRLVGLRFMLALGAALVLAGLAFCEVEDVRRNVLLVMALGTPLLALAAGQVALQARLLPGVPALFGVVTQGLAVFALWSLPFGGEVLPGALAALVIFGRDILNALVAWVDARRRTGFWILPRVRSGASDFLRLAWPQGRFVLLQLAWFHVDMPLMRWLCGEEELGLYAAATRPVLPLLLVPGMLVLPLLPRIASADAATVRVLVSKVTTLLLGIGAVGVVASLFAAEELLALIYPEARATAPATVTSLRWLGIAFGAVFLASAPLAALTARRHERMLLRTGVVALLMNVLANLCWTPASGAGAAAAITAATELVVAGGALLLWWRHEGHPLHVQLLLPALLPAGLLACLLAFMELPGWGVLLLAALALSVFFVLPPLAALRREVRGIGREHPELAGSAP